MDKDYRITSDVNQYILQKYQSGAKDKKNEWRPIKYYSKLEYLLKDVTEMGVRASGAQSFPELIDILKNIESRYAALLRPPVDK